VGRGPAHKPGPVLVAAAAALLVRDAWFSVLTARGGHFGPALVVAAGLELPLAALCLWWR
jgi:hypothetical protein